MEAAGLVTSIVTALATTVIGLVAYRLSQSSQRYSAQRSIGDLQTALARFRADHPEIVGVANNWGDDETGVLHGRVESARRDTIVRYYSYVELGLEFCNTTLAARAKKTLAKDIFERHYRPLVTHFLAENAPFINYVVKGPYLSQYVRDEWARETADAWLLRHARLGATA